MLRELFTPDIEGVKSIRSIGAVLQQILFRFGVLFIRLIFAETKPSMVHLCRLNSKNEVFIILPVEHRHQVQSGSLKLPSQKRLNPCI